MTSVTPHEMQKAMSNGAILKRVETGLQFASGVLIIPAAMASQGHLPFAGWLIAPLLVTLALWFVVMILSDIGRRLGVVETDPSPKSSASVAVFEVAKREPALIVRKADDTLPPRRASVVAGVPVRVAHIPGQGEVRYRISSVA